MEQKKTALIIGAGPAGLTAAYIMLKEGTFRPVILEEETFAGGISRTVEHNGNRMDIGGHRFFSKNPEVNALWQEWMPMQGAPSRDDLATGTEKPLQEGGPDPETTDLVMLQRRRISRIYYLKRFFDYPVSLKWETFRNMGVRRTFRAGMGYLHSVLFKLPEDSLANFYINRFGKPLYEMFFEGYTEKVWGRNPAGISAAWGAQRVKGLSLRKAVLSVVGKPFRKKGQVETSLIEQYAYPKLGPGQLWQHVADEVVRMGGTVVYGAHADRFYSDETGAIREVEAVIDGERRSFCADAFFSTMPVCDLVAGLGPRVPEQVRQIASELPYRDFVTVGLLVDRLALRNETGIATLGNIIPDCWIYVQEGDVRLGRIQIFNNWSPYMVADPEHTVWLGLEYFCNEGDDIWEADEESFLRLAQDELCKIGVLASDAKVLDRVRIRVKKAYPAYFDAYERFDTVREYLDSIPNLWCIGRNGQHRYNNMDHSMLTAIRAARAAAAGQTDKRCVWEVNTEQAYHEEKQS